MKKQENLLKEKLRLEYEDNKESRMIQFLGGKFSIYLLVVTILTFTVVLLYNHISDVFTPIYIIINSLIAPVIVAYIFFYILRPVMDFLVNKLSIPRGISSILSILILITAVIAIVIGALPAIVEQTQHLIASLPSYINVVKEYLAANSDKTIIRTINDYINNNLNTTQISSTAFNIFSGFIGGAASALSSTATVLMTAPFVLYYLLKDSSTFYSFVLGKLPKKSKPVIVDMIKEIDNKVGSYISGQMLVSLCIGVLLFIGYQIIGLPYAVSLATLAAILSIVPYLGPIIAITPAMLVAAGTSWVMVIKMLVVWSIVQFLEGNFISPNIMGKSMNQHPLTVIFVILISANMMGIVGAIIGIPLYAILKILAEKLIYLIKRRYNRIYKN